MNGNKYILDTNFILGLMKCDPIVLAEVSSRHLHVSECAYSAITRMELLGFHRITADEESLIRHKLDRLTYLPLTGDVENMVINLRRTRKIKLPDAIIAATALCAGMELLTLDQHLLSVVNSTAKSK